MKRFALAASLLTLSACGPSPENECSLCGGAPLGDGLCGCPMLRERVCCGGRTDLPGCECPPGETCTSGGYPGNPSAVERACYTSANETSQARCAETGGAWMGMLDPGTAVCRF